jgi:dimeric dUTPase (all-alpha-NTP-PPase superfamily)
MDKFDYALNKEREIEANKHEPNDRLDEMFYNQFKLQEKLGTLAKANTSDIMMQHFIDRMILAIHEEASEILRETMSKHTDMPFGWKQLHEGTEEKYKEEIIDLWHFTMNLWLVVGGTADEFFELYQQKNKINYKRQQENY